MKTGLTQRLTGALTALLMALAMTVAAYAHKVPAGEDLAMQRFILIGGNLNELCGDGLFAPGDCPLCRPVDTAALPEPPGSVAAVVWRFVLALQSSAPPVTDSALAWSVPEARGPPSV